MAFFKSNEVLIPRNTHLEVNLRPARNVDIGYLHQAMLVEVTSTLNIQCCSMKFLDLAIAEFRESLISSTLFYSLQELNNYKAEKLFVRCH